MKEYFGWTQGSDRASIYVHLSGRDVDDTLLADFTPAVGITPTGYAVHGGGPGAGLTPTWRYDYTGTGFLRFLGANFEFEPVGAESPIPEPAGIGLIGIAFLASRRRRS